MTNTLIETKVSETLYKAADLIESQGWTKGAGWNDPQDVENPDGNLCLEGGIMAALGLEWRDVYLTYDTEFVKCPAYEAVDSYLYEERHPNNPRRLYHWNDAGHRTAEEVTALLRAVAEVESEKGN